MIIDSHLAKRSAQLQCTVRLDDVAGGISYRDLCVNDAICSEIVVGAL